MKKKRTFGSSQYRPMGESILKESKIAISFGILGWAIYAFLIWTSYQNKGQAGKGLGFIAWLLFFLAILGMRFVILALQQPGGKTVAKVLGLVLNIVLMVAMVAMLVLGFLA